MYSTAERQLKMLKIIVKFYEKGVELLKKGVTLLQIKDTDVYKEIYRMKFIYSNEDIDKYDELLTKVERLAG